MKNCVIGLPKTKRHTHAPTHTCANITKNAFSCVCMCTCVCVYPINKGNLCELFRSTYLLVSTKKHSEAACKYIYIYVVQVKIVLKCLGE